ncbi:hypothetical protein LLG46_00160 [bacterium]|nr:hypothetical protein [bacterium]
MVVIRMLLAAIVICALPGNAYAAPDTDWHINFSVSIGDSANVNSSFGTKPGATDWFGVEDCPPADGIHVLYGDNTKHAFAYTVLQGNILTCDYRAPITNKAKTWDIWLTASEPGTIQLCTSSLMLDLTNTSETGAISIISSYDGGLASLALWHGSDMLWDWKPGQIIAPTQFFAYNSSAIALRLVATPMPAPELGSVVVILVGVCGFAGFVGKRFSR